MILLLLIVILLVVGGVFWGWPVLAAFLGLSSVTDKPGALQHIRQLMNTYDITPAEVEHALLTLPSNTSVQRRSKGNAAKTLFTYLGAIFILAGVGTYIGSFWQSMGGAMRVAVTLGVGYITFIVLVSALHEGKYPRAILPLTCASVVFMVGGWFVLIQELFPGGDNWHLATIFVFGTIALQFGILFSKYQRAAFAFVALLFVYGFMQVALDWLDVPPRYSAILLGASLLMVGSSLEKTRQAILSEPALLVGTCWLNGGLFDLIARSASTSWAGVLIGICLLLTAYGLHRADRSPRLIGLGYLVGSIILYTGLFDLLRDTSLELGYLAVTASLLYACVLLHSKALLFTSVLAMFSYIGYFSAKHFSDSLGWPITLVLTGAAFMAIGTLALRLKRKF